MKTITCAGLLAVALTAAVGLRAADVPEMPKPTKEHEWLQKFVGEWENDYDIHAEPGKPPMKAKGTEAAKALGGFWVVSEGKCDFGGFSCSNVLTLGYDPQKKKYVGTWVDSMTSVMWKYEGTVDAAGDVLTLETEGPCPCMGNRVTKFKEVTAFKGKDAKTFTSSYQDEAGKWVTLMTSASKRKK